MTLWSGWGGERGNVHGIHRKLPGLKASLRDRDFVPRALGGHRRAVGSDARKPPGEAALERERWRQEAGLALRREG